MDEELMQCLCIPLFPQSRSIRMYRKLLVQETFPTLSILARNLAIPVDPILVDHQSFQPHRSPSMYLIRAYTYFSPESKPHTIGHPGTGIPEDTS